MDLVLCLDVSEVYRLVGLASAVARSARTGQRVRTGTALATAPGQPVWTRSAPRPAGGHHHRDAAHEKEYQAGPERRAFGAPDASARWIFLVLDLVEYG